MYVECNLGFFITWISYYITPSISGMFTQLTYDITPGWIKDNFCLRFCLLIHEDVLSPIYRVAL